MRIIDLHYELLNPNDYSFEEGKKFIERVARTCYKSEHLIQDGSAERMYKNLVSSEHYAMLEHYTVYLCVSQINSEYETFHKYALNKYSKVSYYKDNTLYITTNLRVIIENGWDDDLKYALEQPTEYHEKRYTVKFYANIGVSREYNRHRVNSIAESSTRYCNYSKDKFGNEITVVKPSWYGDESSVYSFKDICAMIANDSDDVFNPIDYWYFSMMACEYSYLNLVRLGQTAQEARGVLPLDTATELVHTAFSSDWSHFFDLRTSIIAKTGKPHPQAYELADPLYKEFVERKYI